jgi:hypothetical protein
MNGELTVYFACTHCELVYQAKQVRLMRQSSGQFVCVKCREPVHSWRGIYTYFAWDPVAEQGLEAHFDRSQLHH